MCIIVVQSISKIIPRKTLETCFMNNPDGAGYMFSHGKNLAVKKGFFTFDNFYQKYKIDHVTYGHSSPFILHFRIATHGDVDKINCHPHRLNDGLAFAHNGIFSSVKDIRAKKSKSDTIRAAIIFKQLPRNWFYTKSMRILVEDFFNNNNSYGAFLDNHGQYWITNKKNWYKKNGVFYSNDSYRDTYNNYKSNWYETPHKKSVNDHDNAHEYCDCFLCQTADK